VPVTVCEEWRRVEEFMSWKSWKILIGVLVLQLGPWAVPGTAQQTSDDMKVVQLTGLAGVKNHTKGTVKVENGNLQFVHAKAKTEVAVSTIEDVITGNDSQRAVHGFVGTLTMLAPYGGGRFLSLFRTKLDTLTLQYRDADGGLHGAIFTMSVGKADALKKLLVAQGAHTSLPTPDGPSAADSKPSAAKEH
jgi:hypothetical protein